MEDSRFNPFPGLRPFDLGEQHLFFGREGQSEQVLRHLRENRLVAVVGTSGSGKSSLIRAGLVPDLYGGFMANAGSHWRFAIFRPMNDPIGNMARALNKTGVLQTELPAEGDQTRSDMLLEVTLRRSGLGLVEAIRLARIPANENLLVVVDQFEELFRFAKAANSASQADDAVAFVKLLLEASRQSEVPIYIVITMRSDFIGDCAKFPDLPEAVTAGMYLIPRMTREQRRRAIEEPVAVGGGAVSLRLVNRLLNEVGDNPDQLPVLQHALMRTWEHWVNRTPTAESFADDPVDFDDYEAIGGIKGALSNHADEAYDALPDARRREIAKRMFQCLTEKDSDNRGVRLPTTVGRIAAVAHASVEEVVDVIEEFHKQGRSFLTTPAGVPLRSDAVIDISHESFGRLWGRLKEWVNEEADSARTYRRLADDAERYARGQVSLLRDPELQNALNWKRDERPSAEWAERYQERPTAESAERHHASFAEVMNFLDRSCEARAAAEAEKERQRAEELVRVRRHLRIVRGLGAIAAVLALAAGVSAYLARIKAKAAEAASAVADTESKRANKEAAAEKVAAERASKEAGRANAEAGHASKEAQRANAETERAKNQTKIADAARANAVFMEGEVSKTNVKLASTNKQLETTNSDLKKEHDLHLASDEKFGNFLWEDMQRFNGLSEETSSRPDLMDILERSAHRRVEVTNDILKTDPDNRNALGVNVITRDDLARIHRKQKSREEYRKTVEDNRATAETMIAASKGYFGRAMGATLLGSSADNFRLLGDKEKALKTAKRAMEVADSIGPDADPKNKDWFYLNFLNLTYYYVGFVDKSYDLNEEALEAYKKAVAPQIKSLHISPTDYAVSEIADTCKALTSLQKTLNRLEDAAQSYQQAIAELDGYSELTHKPLSPNISGVLASLHIDRGDLFREKTKNFPAAEQEYKKAVASVEAIDPKAGGGPSEAAAEDRKIGKAWYALSEAVADADSKNRFANEARKSYVASTEAAAEAVKVRPDDDDARRYLAECYQALTGFEESEDVWNISSAFRANSGRLEALKPLVDRKDPRDKDKTSLAGAYGSRSWLHVLLGEFTSALTDSDEALRMDPDQDWIRANRGHALLFLERTAEASKNYMEFIQHSSRNSDNLMSVTNDFEVFRKRQIPNADLKAVEAMQSRLTTPGRKDLPPAYAGALARIFAGRGDDAREKKKDLRDAEAEYTKAAAAADGIDRKSAEAQAAAILPDRIVGVAWHELAQAVRDAAEKEKFLRLALRFHQRSLDQDLALHQSKPRAEDFSSFYYGYRNMGSDYYLLAEYMEARKLFNSAAETAAQAAKLAPGDDTARRAADSYQVLVESGSSQNAEDLAEQRKADQNWIDVLEPLVKRDNPNSDDVSHLAEAYGTRSWLNILIGDFSSALVDSEIALKLDSSKLWILGNQAHALLFLHRIEEAKLVYLKYAKGDKDDARYQKSVFDDFADFRKRRPPNADLRLVDQMEDFLLTKGGYSKPSEKASN